MKNDPVRAKVLSVRIIPNADDSLLKYLKVPKFFRSLGIITTDIDDVSYAALDESTKKAKVQVVYAKSLQSIQEVRDLVPEPRPLSMYCGNMTRPG